MSIYLNEIGNEGFINLANGLYGICWGISEMIWVGISYEVGYYRYLCISVGIFELIICASYMLL